MYLMEKMNCLNKKYNKGGWLTNQLIKKSK